MLAAALTATAALPNPVFDWHALAPDIILVATIAAVLVADLVLPDREAWQTSRIASIGVLAALVPIATLAASGHDRYMFGGAYAVDHYALALKGFFLVATYVTILLSVDYINEGDYYKGEFYVLLLTSAFGMSVMASARDLITLFVALETISIPTFILATFRKHDRALERGRREVLLDRCPVIGADAVRHVADLRRHRRDEAVRHRRATCRHTARRRCSRSRSSCR